MIKKILLIIILYCLNLFQISNSSENTVYDKIDLFGEVLEKINKEYVEEINQSESMDSAINGLLQSLDPYSAYMSPEIFNEMQTETSGEFGGLGIEVSMESGVVKVISPIDDTPASKAGIKAGDYIVKINDIQVQGKSLSEAVDLMRGPVGSVIELTIIRRGEKRLSHKSTKAALLIFLYRDEPILHSPFNLLSRLMDIDELFTTWRQRHAIMVHRMIGGKIGTGGSSGHKYLKSTSDKHKVFSDLSDLSTFFIRRSALPTLPENIKKSLGYSFQL